MHFDACFYSPEFLNLLQHRLAPASSSQPSTKQKLDEPRSKKPGLTRSHSTRKVSKRSFMQVPSELLALGCVASAKRP